MFILIINSLYQFNTYRGDGDWLLKKKAIVTFTLVFHCSSHRQLSDQNYLIRVVYIKTIYLPYSILYDLLRVYIIV